MGYIWGLFEEENKRNTCGLPAGKAPVYLLHLESNWKWLETETELLGKLHLKGDAILRKWLLKTFITSQCADMMKGAYFT